MQFSSLQHTLNNIISQDVISPIVQENGLNFPELFSTRDVLGDCLSPETVTVAPRMDRRIFSTITSFENILSAPLFASETLRAVNTYSVVTVISANCLKSY